ncbi:glutathione S-transferase family protein [Kordiimonas sp.]|uniref:glutathione S-transferase family protein n=1 Tax=Kordiimonas sp. TaxID=1970157 RepID=UPI003A8D5601
MADHLAGMTLFGAKGGGSAIIEALLAILDLPYARRYLDWDSLHDPSGPLSKVNPACEIPTLLLQDGSVMTESAAITLWLGAERPESGLVPLVGTPEHPEFLRRLIWLVASVYPTFSYGDHPERWLKNEAAAQALRTATDKRREVMWQQFEAAITPAPWLLGDAMTALDIYMAVMTHWRPRRDWFEENCPKLFGIAKRVDTIPELKEVWERNFAP